MATNNKYTYDPATDKAYQKALEQLKQAQSVTPTYKGTYDQQIKDMYDKIANREKFSYDLNADALYNQYKDQYTAQGKMAMMDTMGQAAALTGGYGNSYAQNVGQQAYQGYLQKLNDVVPELYGMALNQYNQEGDRLVQQYGMLGDMADTEYGRYQDDLAKYWQNLSFQKQQADDAYNRGFAQWQSAYENAYQASRDQAADAQWQKEFDEAKRQYDQAYAMQKSAASSSSKSSSSSSSSGKTTRDWGYDTHGYSTSDIKKLQKAAGIDVDGVWGPQTQKAWEEGWRKDGKVDDGDGSGFKTYSEAVAYMKSKGVASAKASNALTESEWKRLKNSGSSRQGANEYSTYQEYLKDYVDYCLGK